MTSDLLAENIGWICGFIILALIVGLAISLLTAPRKRDKDTTSYDNALVILRKRYAKGEITKAEFEHMQAELER